MSERDATPGVLYPLVLEPLQREAIWGGAALARTYGKTGSAEKRIGESWECWDGNRVANGDRRGATLADLRAGYGRVLTGGADPARPFPLLTKFIDAREALSVQVHPDDAYAARVEGQPSGKTECWYVLQADPDASIVLGWTRDTSRGEYLERVADGSLGELLRHVPVRAGDVFHLPAGTMHAIGAGIVLFETQQTSDLTYRIFDYNRAGPDGKPRELHVAKAADVLDHRQGRGGALHALTALVSDTNFWPERSALEDGLHPLDLEEMPLTLTALDKPVAVEARGVTVRLAPYATTVLAAGLGGVLVRALEPEAALLAAGPPRRPDTGAHRFSRAAVDFNASTAYLAQFSG